jgi:hypothetical protein
VNLDMRRYAPHVVQQGEHVVKLAFLHGATPEEIWDHPDNADLKAKRASMHVLCPGDVLHLPEGEREGLPLHEGTKNRFSAQVPSHEVSITLTGPKGPLANEPYEVRGLPQRPGEPPPTGTTGQGGEVALSIPAHVREVSVRLTNQNITYAVRVGDVDPIGEPSGVTRRLENLGFLVPGGGHGAAEVAGAIRAFQLRAGLEVTGELDDATRSKLLDASGQKP